MLLLHTLHVLCGNFHMNIDVPAGVGASPTACMDITTRMIFLQSDAVATIFSLLVLCGYYSRAATIRGRLLFEGSYYSREATIRGWCLGNTIDILIRLYRWEWDIRLCKANIVCNSLWWSIVWNFLSCAWGSASQVHSLSHLKLAPGWAPILILYRELGQKKGLGALCETTLNQL